MPKSDGSLETYLIFCLVERNKYIRTWPFLEERNYIKLKIWSTPPELLSEASLP